ncbi:nuclear hormone receptor HR96-like [Oppia nitens]|uniref:nuclear hormone receptor HR96-like n=1 Tax=Oppia nitens TaxID=1686743 RepID=UPI0023DC7B71|nr:nuclear hormone receptor HR96-like [Oppia nitens]
MSSPERPITTPKELTEIECKRLSDISVFTNIFRYPKTRNFLKIGDIREFYRLWGQWLEFNTQDIVKYTKDMTQYSNLHLDDEIALVKYGCMELIVLFANFYYDRQNDTFTAYMDNNYSFIFPMSLLKSEKRNLYLYYKNYFDKLIPECNRDNIIMNLMTAIVLFNPNRPHLINKNKVGNEQQFYIYLLQRYLLYKCRSQSHEKLSKLMNSLIDLHIISEIEKTNGAENYLQYFGPILKEIYY